MPRGAEAPVAFPELPRKVIVKITLIENVAICA